MFDSRRRSKIKSNKVQQWRIELSSFSYVIKYRSGQQNVGPDTFTRAYCSFATSSLEDLHNNLCHPGVRRMLQFVRAKNLPFSTTEVRRVTSACKICAEVKPQFFRQENEPLIKAMRPMERISIDFKGPVPSATCNKYLLVVIDEFSRFPFVFPCPAMTTTIVLKCLDKLFTLCGTPAFIHSDNGPAFVSREFKNYLIQKRIASSKSSIYHPVGNGQAERTVGTVWKTIQLALKTRNLPMSQWELVVDDALHAMRSLVCTATNASPHERFFNFQRRSVSGLTLPSWMTVPGKVYLRRFVRSSKSDPLVDKVELIGINPTYANVRFSNGREATVSLRDLAPCGGQEDSASEESPPDQNEIQMKIAHQDAQVEATHQLDRESVPDDTIENIEDGEGDSNYSELNDAVAPRRSARINKGVPPARYSDNLF